MIYILLFKFIHNLDTCDLIWWRRTSIRVLWFGSFICRFQFLFSIYSFTPLTYIFMRWQANATCRGNASLSIFNFDFSYFDFAFIFWHFNIFSSYYFKHTSRYKFNLKNQFPMTLKNMERRDKYVYLFTHLLLINSQDISPNIPFQMTGRRMVNRKKEQEKLHPARCTSEGRRERRAGRDRSDVIVVCRRRSCDVIFS